MNGVPQGLLDGLGQWFAGLGELLAPLGETLGRLFSGLPAAFSGMDPTYEAFYIALVRHACPILAFLLLLRCALPLLTFRREPEIWAWLVMPGGAGAGDPLGKRHWPEQELRCIHRPVHRLPEPRGAYPV